MVIVVTIYIFIIILCIVSLWHKNMRYREKIEQLQRYQNIEIGISENEMLTIMGDGYARSLLKNNRVKYEWRMNASSYGSSYKGMSIRTYTGVKKVTIYIKNGYVEEVRPYNV